MAEAMSPRDAAAAIAARLEAAGHTAYFAGGCVRDELLGLHPADHDVATQATPDQIREIFPKARGVGEHFGVMLVRHGGRTVEVATFRGEGSYQDGRRPTQVTFADEVTDALRRDFTINGLFMHPASGRVIDHVGGRADLEARLLRAIGDPDARLEEDRLRLLRAVRFAARFDLSIDPATLAAVRRHAPELRGVSRERVGHEIRRMLAHAGRSAAVSLIEAQGLAPATLLEPEAAFEPRRIASLPGSASIACSLASWMLDRALPQSWAQRLERWTEALVLSNQERDGVAAALTALDALRHDWPGMGVAQRKRLAASGGFADALAILQAEAPGAAGEIRGDLVPLEASGLAPPPLLDGHELQRLGLQPGPAFRRILDAVYDAQLEGRVRTLDEARGWALRVHADPR
ncbi:MAG: CCA tRNA nucleotidyltransferase [Planctomycetes bacterium]|nr:CCA tRNA nucleotidyltransferase [Planctomycetota bacterium]